MIFTERLNLILEQEPDDSNVIGTIVVLHKNNNTTKVLITKRKLSPAAGQWCLPGGHVKKGEEPLNGALRELKEETGLNNRDATFIKTQRAAKGRGRVEFIFAATTSTLKISGGSDSQEVKWVNINNLPKLAFNHNDAVHEASIKLFGNKGIKEYYLPQALEIYDNLLCEGISESKKLKKTVETILDTDDKDKPGLLIAFEGIDGVGKTSQSELLVDWLDDNDYAVTATKWNSSKLLKKAIDKAKHKRMLTPPLYCLLHAADMMVRYQDDIVPALDRNEIVVCDRYWYTSAARDEARGISHVVSDEIYKGLREPDLLLHCTCPIEVAFSRLLSGKGMSYYGSGMDLHLSPSKEENCIKYYKIMDDIYKKILPRASNYSELKMDRTIDQIASDVKKVIGDKFGIGKYTRR